MAALLGLAAAAAWGSADFLGGALARRTGVLPTVFLSQIAGVGVLVVALGVLSPPPDLLGAAWGSMAGGAAGFALIVYFRGLAVGRMGLVAPVTAVVGAGVPVLLGVALGERPSAVAVAGTLAAITAIALLSAAPGHAASSPGRRTRPGLVEALAAGIGFGLYFVFLDRAKGGDVLWPLLASGVASVLVVGAVVLARRRSLRPVRGTGAGILAAGLLGTLGSLAFLLATRQGLLSLVAVLAALSPAATVVLARLFLQEHLRRLQVAGLAFAVAGVALISAG